MPSSTGRTSGRLLALLLLLPFAARAQTAHAPLVPLAHGVAPAVKPAVLDADRRVQVMVKLAGEPVATAQARALASGRGLTFDEQRTVMAGLQSGHDAVARHVAARGGRVIAHLEHAWNGVRVEVKSADVAGLRSVAGVVDVLPVRTYKIDNARSVPFIGAPAVWAAVKGFRGEKVKVGIIDTGIDYTHADFGGPGTPAAFLSASLASTSPADPKLFGPDAPKVKGGIDLVGDDYDAGADAKKNPEKLVPHPDANPLDCNGHGSHVAGTVAGYGVNADGTTYTGPYDANTPSHAFRIGPGVAPKADLYAIRVFGCSGSTDVVTEAIDWAVANGMQVINMSLGSPFGGPDSADAQAASNAAKAGVVVVAAAGNDGPAPYMSSDPGDSAGALSVAAVDSYVTYPGATLTLDGGAKLTAIDANGASLSSGALGVVVLVDPKTHGVALGCSASDYDPAQVAGKLVVTLRGTCARVDRATLGAAAGAAAVAMINTSDTYPPWEGPIPNVSIPFIGVRSSDAAALVAAKQVSLAAGDVANPAARAIASFSSAGPRYGDSALKPDLAAPGVAIFSVSVGTGNDGQTDSGTSMATPHVTGVAALTVQAHPSWSSEDIRAAVASTADPSKLAGQAVLSYGAGLAQPASSTVTQAVALDAEGEDGLRLTSLSYGFAEIGTDYRGVKRFEVRNHGKRAVTFTVSAAPTGGSPHTITPLRTTIRVAAGGHAEVPVELKVPVVSVGDASDLRQVSGLVTLKPVSGDNGGVALHVPYLLVPRARSSVRSALVGLFSKYFPNGEVITSNVFSRVPGAADFYSWGLYSPSQKAGEVDLRAVGVQAYDDPQAGRVLVFAVNTYSRWSNAAPHEYDVLVDVNGDGTPDYAVSALDDGAVNTGYSNGTVASFVINLKTGRIVAEYGAVAPTDGTTLLLPVPASDLGVTAAQPRIAYAAQAFNGFTGAEVTMPGSARFNVFSPALSQPDYQTLAPNAWKAVKVTASYPEYTVTKPRGLMVVSLDNWNGEQAQLLPVR